MSKIAGQDVASVRIRSLTTRGLLVPLSFTLGTSADIVSQVPLLLVNLATEHGTTGMAYTFGYRPSGARAIVLISGKRSTS